MYSYTRFDAKKRSFEIKKNNLCEYFVKQEKAGSVIIVIEIIIFLIKRNIYVV